MPRAAEAEPDVEKKVLKASEQDRPDVAARRVAWIAYQSNWDPNRLVFLDETWAKTNMTRTYGRARKGTRLIAKVPHGHWKTTTFLAGIRAEGNLLDVLGRRQVGPAAHHVGASPCENER